MTRNRTVNVFKVVCYGENELRYEMFRKLAFEKECSISQILRKIVFPNDSNSTNKKIRIISKKNLNVFKNIGFGVNEEQYENLRKLTFKKNTSFAHLLRSISRLNINTEVVK